MIQFPEEYFKREEQNGHVVGELVKRAWAAQLVMLDKIDAICKKYNLTYFAYWGTLLGAVRHNGFIPWDDDLDIALKREDYNKFLEVAPLELPEEYHIINCYTEGDWDNSITRVTNSKYVDFEKKRMQEYYNCPFAVGIDIFALDYIPRNKVEADEQKQILTFIGTLLTVLEERKKAEEEGAAIEELEAYNQEIAASMVTLEKLCGVRFESDKTILQQLYILYDQVSALFTEEESDILTNIPNYMKSGYMVPKAYLEEIVDVPFENTTIPIPTGYDIILRKTYGDYTIPIKGGSTHGEICFKEQIAKISAKFDQETKRVLSEEEQNAALSVLFEKRAEGEKKKVIMVCNSSLETIAHDACAVKKLKDIFKVFEENPDVILWWRPSRLYAPEMYEMEAVLPQFMKEYKELVQEFRNDNKGVFDEGIAMSSALELCDAYYGDDNKIAKVFQLSGKPVMIADYTISQLD